tara:strand:+ start:1543 stop:2121 length:579 start_codon:yes stop_codon:yes gene_type:complete
MELVKVFDNVLDTSTCNNFINLFNIRNDLQKNGITSGGYTPELKITTDTNLSNHDCFKDIDTFLNSVLDNYIHKYFEYMFSLNNQYGIAVNDLKDTGFLMQKYEKNIGYFNYHHDFSSIYENNQIYSRYLVYIFYLNDVDEGGETILWNNYKIKPKRGSLLFFPCTWTYPHKGNIPISHDKYIITGWLYGPS